MEPIARSRAGRPGHRAARAVSRRVVRGLHGRSRRPCARAARGRRDALDWPRSRYDRAGDRARETLAPWRDRVELVHADYRELPTVLAARGIDGIDGALADLGVSSMQFDARGRGFSFRRDEPLDMRMDQTPRADRRRSAARRRRGRAGERDLSVRRGAILAAHRPLASSRLGAAAPIDDDRRSWPQIVRRAMPRHGLSAHRSGDAHVSGAADLGQPRAGGARRVSRGRVAAACAPARGSRSSRFIRSRIASSSTRSGRWRPAEGRCAC